MSCNFVLGTVQLGLDYGISNRGGKPDKKEAFTILDRGVDCGIDTLDTAYMYGNSEEIIGEYLEGNGSLNVITKIPPFNKKITYKDLEEVFSESLERLRCSSIYGVMFHDYNTFVENRDVALDFFKKLKNEKKVQKTGVSLYNSRDIDTVLEHPVIDIIQIPMNCFDLDLYKMGYVDKLNKRGIELHIRSVFLQGLFFMDIGDIEKKIPKALPFIKEMNAFIEKKGLNKSSLVLSLVSHILGEAGKIVFGVDNPDQINENLNLLDLNNITQDVLDFFVDLSSRVPAEVKNPALWGSK